MSIMTFENWNQGQGVERCHWIHPLRDGTLNIFAIRNSYLQVDHINKNGEKKNLLNIEPEVAAELIKRLQVWLDTGSLALDGERGGA